jgi:hypothetical protein
LIEPYVGVVDMYDMAKVFIKVAFRLDVGAAIAGGIMISGSEFYLLTKTPNVLSLALVGVIN